MISIGTWQAGTSAMPARSGFILAGLAVVLLASGCLFVPRDPTAAEAAVQSWLTALTTKDGETAWLQIAPATQQRVYGGDRERFAAEVAAADWGAMQWEIPDPPAWTDAFWIAEIDLPHGVSSVPGFLLDNGLVAPVRAGPGRAAAVIITLVEVDQRWRIQGSVSLPSPGVAD